MSNGVQIYQNVEFPPPPHHSGFKNKLTNSIEPQKALEKKTEIKIFSH